MFQDCSLERPVVAVAVAVAGPAADSIVAGYTAALGAAVAVL